MLVIRGRSQTIEHLTRSALSNQILPPWNIFSCPFCKRANESEWMAHWHFLSSDSVLHGQSSRSSRSDRLRRISRWTSREDRVRSSSTPAGISSGWRRFHSYRSTISNDHSRHARKRVRSISLLSSIFLVFFLGHWPIRTFEIVFRVSTANISIFVETMLTTAVQWRCWMFGRNNSKL